MNDNNKQRAGAVLECPACSKRATVPPGQTYRCPCGYVGELLVIKESVQNVSRETIDKRGNKAGGNLPPAKKSVESATSADIREEMAYFSLAIRSNCEHLRRLLDPAPSSTKACSSLSSFHDLGRTGHLERLVRMYKANLLRKIDDLRANCFANTPDLGPIIQKRINKLESVIAQIDLALSAPQAPCKACAGLLSTLKTMVDHAQEQYPHFESERGQLDIAAAQLEIAKAEHPLVAVE